MRDINIKKSFSLKPYILAWIIIAVAGNGYYNLGNGHPFLWSLQCSRPGFSFVSACLSSDIFQVIGFGLSGLITGLLVALLIKFFRKSANVWLIAFRIALVFGLIALYGAST